MHISLVKAYYKLCDISVASYIIKNHSMNQIGETDNLTEPNLLILNYNGAFKTHLNYKFNIMLNHITI